MNWNAEQKIKEYLLKYDPAKLDFSEGFYENMHSNVMLAIENKEIEKCAFQKINPKLKLIHNLGKNIK